MCPSRKAKPQATVRPTVCAVHTTILLQFNIIVWLASRQPQPNQPTVEAVVKWYFFSLSVWHIVQILLGYKQQLGIFIHSARAIVCWADFISGNGGEPEYQTSQPTEAVCRVEYRNRRFTTQHLLSHVVRFRTPPVWNQPKPATVRWCRIANTRVTKARGLFAQRRQHPQQHLAAHRVVWFCPLIVVCMAGGDGVDGVIGVVRCVRWEIVWMVWAFV